MRAPKRRPLLRVVVYVDANELEQLEQLVRYRHGPHSRSEIVRDAIAARIAKEAAWLHRARRQEQLRAEAAEAIEQARRLSGEERRRLSEAQSIDEALRIARDPE